MTTAVRSTTAAVRVMVPVRAEARVDIARRRFMTDHPYGFYISDRRAYPFNRHYGLLGSDRARTPPPFYYRREFLYDDATAPWHTIREEAAYHRRVADVGKSFEMAWSWEEGPAPEAYYKFVGDMFY